MKHRMTWVEVIRKAGWAYCCTSLLAAFYFLFALRAPASSWWLLLHIPAVLAWCIALLSYLSIDRDIQEIQDREMVIVTLWKHFPEYAASLRLEDMDTCILEYRLRLLREYMRNAQWNEALDEDGSLFQAQRRAAIERVMQGDASYRIGAEGDGASTLDGYPAA